MITQSARRRASKGFTLLELLVVMVIIGLLAGLVAPRYFAQVGKSEVKTTRAQIDAFEKALGFPPDHIDGHQHVHALPALFGLVVRIAKEAGIPRVRVPLDSPFRAGALGSSRFLGKAVLCLLSLPAQSAVNAAGLRSCTRMIGLFESGALSEQRLLSMLEQLEDSSTELMCHPGHTDPKYAHWNFHWEEELQALTSPAVRALLTARGIELSSSC